MNYAETLDYLEALEKLGSRPGLENISKAAEDLGNPQNAFRAIQIAGTNGKGSACAFLNQILMENKYRTGFYSSPHLVQYNERVQINRQPISNAAFAKLATEIRETLEQNKILATQFEFLTLLAFQWFARQKVEIAVLEAGMGGRLDATNIVSSIAGGITNIEWEHQEFLGNSLREIAFEKAGIIKEKSICATTETRPELVQLLQDLANGKKASFFQFKKDFDAKAKSVSLEKTTMDFKGLGLELHDLELGLVGRHQAENAALALAILGCLKQQNKIRLSRESIVNGLKKTKWSARFQVLKKEPLVIADACHNPAGATILAQALKDTLPGRKVTLVFGAATDKKANDMLATLSPFAEKIVLCQAKHRGRNAEELGEMAKAFLPSFKISVVPNVKQAVKQALANARPNEEVLVCGSIFLLGEAWQTLARKQ